MLEFELTGEDLMAYNVYGATQTPAAKKRSAQVRPWVSLAILAAVTIVSGLEGNWLEGLVVGAIAGAVLWLAWPPIWVWTIRRNVLRFAKTGGLGTPGPCRIWIDDDGIS